MAAYINNIVDAAHYPEITLLVAPGAVSGEINPVNLRPILLFVTLVIAPDGPEHRGPGPLDDKVTALICANRFAVAGHDAGVDTGEGLGCGAGLGGSGAGNGSNHDCTRLGLPPRVHDRTPVFADYFAIPHPRLGIDRLTDCAEQSQAREVVLERPVLAPLDEGADSSRSSVENVHAVALDHGPETIGLREVR